MRYCRLVILFICTLLLSRTIAQQKLNFLFRHISEADGLLHNHVLSIAQDSKGFVWIATPKGLQRYDGSRFTSFPEMLNNPVEGSMYDAALHIDKENNQLWISNSFMLKKMEIGKNRFTVYNLKESVNDPSFIFTTYLGQDDQRWAINTAAVYHFDSAKKKYAFFHPVIFPVNTHQTSFIASDSNATWVAASSRLYLFDKKNQKVWSNNYNPTRHPLLQSLFQEPGEKFLRFIMIDSRQNIWVTSWGDVLYKYNNETRKISRYSLTSVKIKEDNNHATMGLPLINCMLEDDNHTIWVGTENAGLLRYNSEKDNFDYCIAQDKNSESIQYNYKIFSLFQDKEQNLWIGTDKGISIFNPYRQDFKSIRHEENNPLSLPKSELLSFIQISSGDMYLGTWGGGIAVYDNSFQFKRKISFTGPSEKNYVWSFLQVDDKTLWIGCQHGYLHVFDISSKKIQTLHPPEMEGSTIRCMEKDKAGNIWLGLHNGKIVKWDKSRQMFFPFKTGVEVTGSVLNIFIDRAQDLWISTESGFKKFDPGEMEYSDTWLPCKNNATSLSEKICQGIEEYNDSTLLIGTVNGGLNFFHKKTKSFSHLSNVDGLPSNSIFAVKKDTAGYIWFTTDYGLYKFDPVGTKFIRYSSDPHIINSSFQSNKFYPLQNGQWLTFTTTEAISFFPHKASYRDNEQLKTEITGFKLFDAPLFIDSLLPDNKALWLSYKENFFTIEFAALNFSEQQQTNYFYRLGGIDKDWVNVGTRRFANYTNLQPGKYVFEVKAENGSNSGKITSFKIVIAPPFWQTWWFISTCIALVSLSAYWLFRRRIKAVRHEAEMKQTIAETEMMALRAQMNPHFIFNCLNSIDNLIQTEQKEKATDYLAKFALLIRAILENSKSNTIPCWKDLETLQLYLQLEELRWDKKITCDMIIANEIQNGDYKVPPMIVQPFVENAIHHGLLNKVAPDKKLSIEVKLEENKIKYTIMDNGIGRLKGDEYKKLNRSSPASLGMQITKDRINLFNQHTDGSVKITDLYNELQQPAGTIVEVWLSTQPITN